MSIVITPPYAAPSAGIRGFAELVNEIAPHVLGCPPTSIIAAARKAALELCRDGYAWMVDLDPIDVVADIDAYEAISPFPEGRVFTVLRVIHNDAELPGITWDMLIRRNPTHPDIAVHATPAMYSIQNSQWISLFPVPDTSITGGLRVHATLVPVSDSVGIERRVMDDYEDAIIRGALHRLLIMPNKTWTDIKLSDFYGRKFKHDVSQCRARVNKGLMNKSLRVAFPRIA